MQVENPYKTKPINTYDEAELLAIEKALNIVSTTSTGDILLFSLSTKNIQARQMFPLMSDMPMFKKRFIN